MRIDRSEPGEGTVLYSGEKQGDWFLGIDLRGLSGWQSSRWMPGGWSFFNPTVHFGHLFEDRGRIITRHVLLPAHFVDGWRAVRRAFKGKGVKP